MKEVLKNARDTALDVLMSVHKANAWSDGGLKRAIAKNRLDSRDAALTTRLCYGVLQNKMLLDFYIGCYCAQRPEKLEPVILNILRLGAYQILFMDRIPNSAAVNESVEMSKRNGRPKAAGMVNAVLRKFVIHWLDMPPLPASDAATRLSLRYSHPKWLVQRLLALLPPKEAEEYLRLDNEPVPTAIQTNTLLITPEKLEKELRSEQLTLEAHPWLEGCFYISGTGNLEHLPSFEKGYWMVQDPAAKLVALAAAPAEKSRVLDVCAAPGGKTFAVAMAQHDTGDILACDVHPHKLRLIESSVQRLHLSSVRTALADGREKHAAWVDQVDLVVADVPCSGLGIIRKKPDIRYKSEKEIAGLPAIQRAILNNAANYVRPGGVLIYSTCTVLPEENEGVTDAFLQAHPDFRREPFVLPSPIEGTDGQITLWPQRFGTDGFYICRMRREGKA